MSNSATGEKVSASNPPGTSVPPHTKPRYPGIRVTCNGNYLVTQYVETRITEGGVFYEGIAGAHSRDYGFLTGHGYLDQQLMRAGWLKNTSGESHPAIDDVTFWNPPAEIRAAIPAAPRVVTQRFGTQPWEHATHYVGKNFSLGSSGAGYGAQDKVLTLTLAGGPKLPLVNFALDYHRDPYGQQQLATADGHSKLTHLLPFISSVQRGPEALLIAAYNPATARNPIGGKAPIAYESVNAKLNVNPYANADTDRIALLWIDRIEYAYHFSYKFHYAECNTYDIHVSILYSISLSNGILYPYTEYNGNCATEYRSFLCKCGCAGGFDAISRYYFRINRRILWICDYRRLCVSIISIRRDT